MGLDLLDVAFRIEKTFEVPRASDFEQLVRDRDIVVGDLFALVLRKVHVRDTVRYDVRLNFALWEEVQQDLSAAAGVALDDVQLKTPLERLFPRAARRAAWQSLRSASRYRIATLDYPKAVRPIGFSLAAAMALVEQLRIWQLPGIQWLWPILGLIGIWIFAETYGKLMSVFARWRIRFPQAVTTVKDLARAVVGANYEEILADNGKTIGKNEIPGDDRCRAVWRQLKQILSDALGVDSEKITLQSRLFADLGAD